MHRYPESGGEKVDWRGWKGESGREREWIGKGAGERVEGRESGRGETGVERVEGRM